MKILLIGGGHSKERDLSIKESARIGDTLKKSGHEVFFLDPVKDLKRLIHEAEKSDFAYICLKDVDGMIQSMLERLQCPYSGSDPVSLNLAKNKSAAKLFFIHNEMLTPEWEFISERPETPWKTELTYPIVAKPNRGGSSIGVSIIKDKNYLDRAIDEIFDIGDRVILESYIPGKEVACAVLGNEALPPILIIPKGDSGFFDYKCKYTPEGADEISPAPISRELTCRIQDMALKAHNILGLKGYSRADFIINNDDVYILEINSQPGLVHTSLLPKEAYAAGLSFEALLEKIIEYGCY